jgi:hypothetical protein
MRILRDSIFQAYQSPCLYPLRSQVWEPSVLELFSRLGNTAVNAVWEARLLAQVRGRAAVWGDRCVSVAHATQHTTVWQHGAVALAARPQPKPHTAPPLPAAPPPSKLLARGTASSLPFQL